MNEYESLFPRLRKCAEILLKKEPRQVVPLVITLGELLVRYECLEHDAAPRDSPQTLQFVRDVECFEAELFTSLPALRAVGVAWCDPQFPPGPTDSRGGVVR